MRLFNGFKPEEGKLAQYAAVYVLKWRPEFGEPEMLFCEVDEEDDSVRDGLVTALKRISDRLPEWEGRNDPPWWNLCDIALAALVRAGEAEKRGAIATAKGETP